MARCDEATDAGGGVLRRSELKFALVGLTLSRASAPTESVASAFATNTGPVGARLPRWRPRIHPMNRAVPNNPDPTQLHHLYLQQNRAVPPGIDHFHFPCTDPTHPPRRASHRTGAGADDAVGLSPRSNTRATTRPSDPNIAHSRFTPAAHGSPAPVGMA